MGSFLGPARRGADDLGGDGLPARCRRCLKLHDFPKSRCKQTVRCRCAGWSWDRVVPPDSLARRNPFVPTGEPDLTTPPPPPREQKVVADVAGARATAASPAGAVVSPAKNHRVLTVVVL